MSTTLAAERSSAATISSPPQEALAGGKKVRVGARLVWLRVKEYVTTDSRRLRWLAGVAGYLAAMVLGWLGRSGERLKLLCRLHRADLLPAANRLAEQTVQRTVVGKEPQIQQMLADHIARVARTAGTANFFDDPRRILGPAVIVLKSPKGREKGLIVAHYNHVLPVLAKFFNLNQIAARYHIAIEPSWSGFCDPDIVSYCQYRFPVFVEAYEPRDAAFVRATRSNLLPVPTSTNWWVDHRVFHPIPGVAKDIDVAVVAGWGGYKRHYRFFDALARLRRQGHRLRVMLIGYSVGWTKQTVLDQARYYGIADQLEVHEGVPYEQVNDLVNRAKIHVLWSRKEGVNRAIIECMFAGVPSIVRDGFNYGYRYPYVNDETGCFADEESLPRKMLELAERSEQMRPRDWVMEHMSCQRATEILSEAVGQWCAANGEPWTESPVVKVTNLHKLSYWDAADAERFKEDYEWIGACRQGAVGA